SQQRHLAVYPRSDLLRTAGAKDREYLQPRQLPPTLQEVQQKAEEVRPPLLSWLRPWAAADSSGFRIPCCRCYYTEEYCRAHGKTYKKQTELAAQLIEELVVPPEASVVVLGDTAFEAKVIRQACGQRGWIWIVPINPERVLAGDSPRPK